MLKLRIVIVGKNQYPLFTLHPFCIEHFDSEALYIVKVFDLVFMHANIQLHLQACFVDERLHYYR